MKKEVTQEKKKCGKEFNGYRPGKYQGMGKKKKILSILCQYNISLGFFQKYLLYFSPVISILRILSF